MLDIVEDKQDTDQHLNVDVHVAQHGEDIAGGQRALPPPSPPRTQPSWSLKTRIFNFNWFEKHSLDITNHSVPLC